MTTGHLGFPERDEQAEAQDLLSEIPFVQIVFKHCLVEVLELRERELGRQQLEANRLDRKSVV